MITPTLFSSKIIAAQSTREGGVSPPPFCSLNLGLSVKDDEKNVLKNRELFFGRLGIQLSQLAKSHQVHGNNVLAVNTPGSYQEFDALITNRKNTFLVVSIADCTPILIHDERNNAVAAIHAGWRGTYNKIVNNALTIMNRNYGTEGKHCKAFIGACIGYKNFEVGEEVAVKFDDAFKKFNPQKQKWLVDLKSANKVQLLDFGVLPNNIEIADYCTVENNNLFFSHRKEKGITGRMMAVIGIK